MRRIDLIQLAVFVFLSLVLIAGCAPGPTAVPTPIPTFTPVVQEGTPVVTATEPTLVVPSATPVQATATSVAAATDTPIPTSPPPTDTSVPTDTPVPTDTSAPPTDTPVPPTATPVPPTSTPRPPTATPVPPTPTPVQITDWRGAYFDNPTLQGQPKVVRNDRVVDLNLSAGQAPASGIPSESWSARWSRQWTFDEGNYRFNLLVDDGARLWVDDILLIDAWYDGAPREFAANAYLSGQTPIRLEYYNRFGPARARLNWDRITDYPDWQGAYYPVRDLAGKPRFARNDPAIDFNWGADSPRADIPVDNFSVRWTRRLQLSQGGTYRFLVVSDDGARLWVDGRLIVDAWRDGYTTDEATIELAAGGHDVRLEYYEHLGGALIRLTWSLIPATPSRTPIPATATPTPTAIPPTPTPIPPTPTPTRTPIPPTPTSAPTLAPPPLPSPTVPPIEQAIITLRPAQGPVGQPIAVLGERWPANTTVEILLGPPGERFDNLVPVGKAAAGPDGRFQTRIVVPENQGWEARGAVRVIALVPGQSGFAQAIYDIQPQDVGRTVPFEGIPADAPRFALKQPTFLALDSAPAWAEHFGDAPPPAEPPVDWQREYVLGAFFGPLSDQREVVVESVTARGEAVLVRLSASSTRAPGVETGLFPRVLIRVSRDALGIPGEPVFTFVDAQGQVLASGQAGAEPLPTGRERQVPGVVGTPGVELAPGIQSVPEVAPQEAPAEPEAPAQLQAPGAESESPDEVQPEAAAAQIVETKAPEEGVPWQQSAAGWIALLVWGVLIVFLIGGAFLLIRWAIRRA